MAISELPAHCSIAPVPAEIAEDSWWAVVLAGGEGRRMRPWIERCLDQPRPKQYCTFVGTRSMLQHTADRVSRFVPQENTITIIGHRHRGYLEEAVAADYPGQIVEQPADRGTAAGIFLAAAHALSRQPDATLLILPSDHFFYPEQRLTPYLTQALRLADRHEDRLILLGAAPNRAETEYGWIKLERANGRGSRVEDGPRAFDVASFREKPGSGEARRLFDQGCLWNTMIIAVKAETLWEMGCRVLPDMTDEFSAYREALESVAGDPAQREDAMAELSELYGRLLEPTDFSRQFLQKVASRIMVMPLDDIDWCDWGSPQRVSETLQALGKSPSRPFQDSRDPDLHPTLVEPS